MPENPLDPNPAGEPAPAGGDPNPVTPSAPAADPAAAQALAAAQQSQQEATARADQAQAALDAINQALNPGGDGSAQDPAALAAQVAERDTQLATAGTQLRTAQVELAAYRAAGKEGAHPERLLNSRDFLTAVAALDPADPGFAAALSEAIKTTVAADPELYRATPAGPTRGGAEFGGPPAGERKPATLHDAIAARFAG